MTSLNWVPCPQALTAARIRGAAMKMILPRCIVFPPLQFRLDEAAALLVQGERVGDLVFDAVDVGEDDATVGEGADVAAVAEVGAAGAAVRLQLPRADAPAGVHALDR